MVTITIKTRLEQSLEKISHLKLTAGQKRSLHAILAEGGGLYPRCSFSAAEADGGDHAAGC